MPVIVRLQHCVIRMFFRDHGVPHFHIGTTGGNAVVAIETLEVLEGQVDRRALKEAVDWARENRVLLRKAWEEFNP